MFRSTGEVLGSVLTQPCTLSLSLARILNLLASRRAHKRFVGSWKSRNIRESSIGAGSAAASALSAFVALLREGLLRGSDPIFLQEFDQHEKS